MFGVFSLLDRLSGLQPESSYHRLETLSRELLKVRAFIVGLGAASFVLLGLSGFLEISVVPILILFTVLFCLNFAYAWLISFRHSLELVCFFAALGRCLGYHHSHLHDRGQPIRGLCRLFRAYCGCFCGLISPLWCGGRRCLYCCF